MKVLNILLIEDDAIEVLKFNRTVSSLGLKHKVIEANNGEDAIKLLEIKENLPDIILLDLNMPRLNGIEFLTLLKQDDILKYIPTIILTTSSNKRDLLRCFEIGVSGYILKPLKYEDYVTKIQRVLQYWSINELI
jgi:CheY-like chemotaxis protein